MSGLTDGRRDDQKNISDLAQGRESRGQLANLRALEIR